MAYPVTKLINRAFYLSGIVAREFETISGSMFSDGLDLLNSLLDVQSANTKLIPYYKRYELQLQAGVEEYFIPNLYDVESFTFNINQVRFASQKLKRNDYFATARVNGITALPFSWHWERETGGTRLFFYYLPDSNYLSQLIGKFGLTDVVPTTDLNDAYDNFYIEWLRYGLAQYICDDYDIEFSPQKVSHMSRIARTLMNLSPPDLTMTKTGMISNSRRLGLTWAQANIGKGYSPL